jgi:DNA-binding NtrC family response regulator
MREYSGANPGVVLTDCPVVLQVRGNGKIVIARAIHEFSARGGGPFVRARMGPGPAAFRGVLFEAGMTPHLQAATGERVFRIVPWGNHCDQ